MAVEHARGREGDTLMLRTIIGGNLVPIDTNEDPNRTEWVLLNKIMIPKDCGGKVDSGGLVR
jgi:hypothetical protein